MRLGAVEQQHPSIAVLSCQLLACFTIFRHLVRPCGQYISSPLGRWVCRRHPRLRVFVVGYVERHVIIWRSGHVLTTQFQRVRPGILKPKSLSSGIGMQCCALPTNRWVDRQVLRDLEDHQFTPPHLIRGIRLKELVVFHADRMIAVATASEGLRSSSSDVSVVGHSEAPSPVCSNSHHQVGR